MKFNIDIDIEYPVRQVFSVRMFAYKIRSIVLSACPKPLKTSRGTAIFESKRVHIDHPTRVL